MVANTIGLLSLSAQRLFFASNALMSLIQRLKAGAVLYLPLGAATLHHSPN
jgi:hypothetical protein